VLSTAGWDASVATASKARRNGVGSSLPRLAARRRIPVAAFWLKKNLGGALGSSMSDNEHTSAALGHSEVLSVKDAVGVPIPDPSQRPEDGAHIPAVV